MTKNKKKDEVLKTKITMENKRTTLSIIGETIYIWSSILGLKKKIINSKPVLYANGFFINYQLILSRTWELPSFITKGFTFPLPTKIPSQFILDITNPPHWIFLLFNLILFLFIILILKITLILNEKGNIEEFFLIESNLSEEKDNFLGRIYGSYRNELENLPIFGLSLLVATMSNISNPLILQFSVIYFISRLFFHLFYILNLSTLRSIVFVIGLTNLILLMFISSSTLKISDIIYK